MLCRAAPRIATTYRCWAFKLSNVGSYSALTNLIALALGCLPHLGGPPSAMAMRGVEDADEVGHAASVAAAHMRARLMYVYVYACVCMYVAGYAPW